ncbi:MAG TPA: hypothetical protein VK081_07710, partial [Planctomycetota bacterium]|nr:hypothetical protein [Planctomycetota bacterium]
ATTGTFSALLAGATLADIATRAETAIWQPQNLPGPNFAYLQHPNHWVMFPTQAIDQLAHTAGSIVVAEAGGGLWGLSLHGSSWVHQATPPIDDLWTGTSRPAMEMTVVARAGLDLWAFNARTSEWRHTQTSAPATLFQGNNTALIVSDGARAYGFSSWSDRWSSVALAGPVARSSAQVQAAFVDDGTSVHAYSGFGQVSTSHDYPEYWRAATLGARVHVHVAGEPGAVSVLAMSPVATHLPIPGLGTLRIDPATMGVLALPVLPSDGIFALRMQVPNVPALRGLGLHFQAMVAGPAAYLTNAVTVQLL